MTTTEINKALKRVANKFEYHVGSYQKTKQQFPEILRPSGLKNAGYIMPYKEALERQIKSVDASLIEEVISRFTKDYYKQEVARFEQTYKERLSVRTETRVQRERLSNIVIDSLERTGTKLTKTKINKIKSMPYKELRDIVRSAHDDLAENNWDNKSDSPKFWELVVYHYSGNGDAETE